MEAETSSINGRENLCDNKQVEDKSIQDNSHHNLTADQQAVREKKLEHLRNSISHLEEEITLVKTHIQAMKLKVKNPDVEQTVQRHIKLLHSYNEIKDVGQGLLGLIADARGCRFVDVLEEFGLSVDD